MITKNTLKYNTPYRRTRRENRTMADIAFDAQKIAFAPISFQAALALRDLGILSLLNEKEAEWHLICYRSKTGNMRLPKRVGFYCATP